MGSYTSTVGTKSLLLEVQVSYDLVYLSVGLFVGWYGRKVGLSWNFLKERAASHTSNIILEHLSLTLLKLKLSTYDNIYS